MDFLWHWLQYLVAFGLGSLLTFFVAARVIRPTSEHAAFADLDAAVVGAEQDSPWGVR